jgi:hypothetical protein
VDENLDEIDGKTHSKTNSNIKLLGSDTQDIFGEEKEERKEDYQ